MPEMWYHIIEVSIHSCYFARIVWPKILHYQMWPNYFRLKKRKLYTYSLVT